MGQDSKMKPIGRKLTMDGHAVFRICIQGVLDESWVDYLGLRAISVEVDEAGIAATFLTTEPVDQAALVGLINRLNSLCLPLLAVEPLSIARLSVNQAAGSAVQDHKPPLDQNVGL
jgi:hypothetical protein